MQDVKVSNSGGIILLGKQGENLARRVQFDISRWISTFGMGTVQLLHQRSGDEAPYPVAVEQDGTLAIWKVSSADTARPGGGHCELRYYVDETLAKSETWMTKVLPALGDASETPPEAQQGWVDQVLQAGAAAVEAAEKAETAAVRQPYPNAETGTWWVWDAESGAYADTGISYGTGAGGGVTDHDKLKGRNKADQHPISAITGLEDALAGKQPTGSYLTAETDPTVPAWAKAAAKPGYTASEVGADPSGTAAAQVSAHNTEATAHSDIRLLIKGLTDRLNALADSDDTTLDQLSEIVAYIKDNRDLIAAITTSKVSVSDIVDNLTTNVANAPLSAAQGVALKALIDAMGIKMDKTDLNIDWSFADGMPEDKGLTYTGTEGKAVMQSDGLLISPGAAYQPPVLAAGKASVECVFSSPNFGDYYGFRLQLTNGTTGIRISCYDNALIYNQGTDNNLTIASLSTDTEYTLRIVWDEESGADVYLNGESVLTGGKTSYALAENLVSQVSGGGAILLKSLAYTFPGMGDEIVSIDGKGLRDETARAIADQVVALKAMIDAISIPEKLPNPNALTFTGAVEDSYDGSEEKTINIPTIDDVIAALPTWEGGSY